MGVGIRRRLRCRCRGRGVGAVIEVYCLLEPPNHHSDPDASHHQLINFTTNLVPEKSLWDGKTGSRQLTSKSPPQALKSSSQLCRLWAVSAAVMASIWSRLSE